MKNEDDAVKRNTNFYQGLIEQSAGSPEGGDMADDDMGHMVLGDMKTEHHYHENQPQQTPPRKSGWIAKTLAGAALIATGAGATVGVPLLLDGIRSRLTPSPVVQPEPETKTETVYKKEDWSVGEPYFGEPE